MIRVERLLKLTPVQEVPSAEMRAQMMCTLLKHLVLALIKAPCVLVVEDAHVSFPTNVFDSKSRNFEPS